MKHEEPERPLAPGTRLGKFKILRLLAVGGMAEIYLARVTGIEGFAKAVVLKRILPELANNPEFVEMFLDEARLAATFQHPNVVQVYDIGRVEGSYFFTMEYVHGEDVRGILAAAKEKRRGLKLAHALSIVYGAAAGLDYVHDQKGLDGQPLSTVHRDVSPANVMVTFDGGVKLVDFGIAQAVARQIKTKSGATKGTVTYMSPEQCRGADIDRRSDVFALGILLFELTTGTRLFRKVNDYAIAHQLVNEDAPRPSSRREGYPPGLERIVVKALARDPEARYQTAEELLVELEEFARDEKIALSSVALGRFMREVFESKSELGRLDRTTLKKLELDADRASSKVAKSDADDSAVASETGEQPRSRSFPYGWLAGALALTVIVLAATRGTEPSPTQPPAAASSAIEPEGAPSGAAPVAREQPPRAPDAATPSAPASSAPAASVGRPRKPRSVPSPKPTPKIPRAPSATPEAPDKPWDLDSPLPPP